MTKNDAREFATMDDERRRRFAQEGRPTGDEGVEELRFPDDDPRDEEHMGRHYQHPAEEYANPEHRDGPAAQLDDTEHLRRVSGRKATGKRSRRRGGHRS